MLSTITISPRAKGLNAELTAEYEAILGALFYRLSKGHELDTVLQERFSDLFELRLQLVTTPDFDKLVPDPEFPFPEVLEKAPRHLANNITFAYEIYRRALIALIDNISTANVPALVGGLDLAEQVDAHAVSYDTFQKLRSFQQPQLTLFADWLDQSLRYELLVALVVDILENNRKGVDLVKLGKEMRYSIEKFGALTSLLGYWDLDLEPDSQEITNTRITRSILRSRYFPATNLKFSSAQAAIDHLDKIVSVD